MLVVTHRLPRQKNVRAGERVIGSPSIDEYHQQLTSIGLIVVPDALRSMFNDRYGRNAHLRTLPFPPEVYGRHANMSDRKSETTAVVYPEGWQAILPEDENNSRFFNIVDAAGEVAVTVFAKVNDVSDGGWPTFRVGIRGFDSMPDLNPTPR